MASYANFINAEVQSHYANETYVNSLDKYSSLRLKFLFFIYLFNSVSPPFPVFGWVILLLLLLLLLLAFCFLGGLGWTRRTGEGGMRSSVQGRTSKRQGLFDKFAQLFSTREIYSCIVDFFFKLLAGIRQLIGEGKFQKKKKKSYGQQAANQNARASNEGD